MTTDEIKAFGQIYGILDGLLRLTAMESKLAPFDPAGQLPKALTRRMKKISEETNQRIAEISARISPDAVGRLTQEETGAFWIGFYAAPRPVGRPALNGERMVSKNIRIPADLWDKAAEKAGQHGTNVSELIRRYLSEYAGE
jgi:hypothetical protein